MVFKEFELEYYEIPESENLLLHTSGNNKKKLLVALPTFTTGESYGLLKKILLAINLDLEEDCLLLQAEESRYYPIGPLIIDGGFDHALLFGIDPLQLGLQIESGPFRFLNIGNCRLLASISLGKLMQDKQAKQDLWSALKEEFKS